MRIAILAGGRSLHDYIEACRLAGGPHRLADQVWAINDTARLMRCDRIVAIDNPSLTAAINPQLDQFLRSTSLPILSTHAHPEWPTSHGPSTDRLAEKFGGMHITCSASMALIEASLYASHIDVYGVDFTSSTVNALPGERENFAYWAGLLRGQGHQISLAPSCPILGNRAHLDPNMKPVPSQGESA